MMIFKIGRGGGQRFLLLSLFCFLRVAGASGETVTGIRFENPVHRSGDGDNWHITWAADDNQYTALGDGRGWKYGPYYNTTVYRLVGQAPAFAPDFLPGYPVIPRDVKHWYGYGLLAIDKCLYHFIGYLDQNGPIRFTGAKLVFSPNLGQTWKNRDGSAMSVPEPSAKNMFFWGMPDQAFSLISVLQYGRNYEDNRDGHVYLYAPNGNDDETMRQLLLARVPKGKIRDRRAYEFFTGRDASGGASWSKDFEQRGAVFAFPEGWVAEDFRYSWHPSVVYNRALDVYLMPADGTGKDRGPLFHAPSYLGIYTAPKPWGPWTPVHEDPSWTVEGDPETRLYEPVIAPKWIRPDGRSFWLIFSDAKNWGDWDNLPNYKFCLQEAHILTGP